LPDKPEEVVEDRDELFSQMMEAKRNENVFKYLQKNILIKRRMTLKIILKIRRVFSKIIMGYSSQEKRGIIFI